MHVGVGHDENPPGRGSGRYAFGSGKRGGDKAVSKANAKIEEYSSRVIEAKKKIDFHSNAERKFYSNKLYKEINKIKNSEEREKLNREYKDLIKYAKNDREHYKKLLKRTTLIRGGVTSGIIGLFLLKRLLLMRGTTTL